MRERLPRWVVGGGSIAVAIGIMNIATYSFTMIAARMLGPQPYGALASLMATLLVFGVLQLGLQATAARRISADPDHVGQIETTILRVSYRAALALGLLLLLLSPVIKQVLRLDGLLTAVLVAVAVVPMTVMGGQAGILQGERRWLPLALVYLANGVPRLVIGLALIAWRPTEFVAMLAVVLGQMVPVAVGWFALRRHQRSPGASSTRHRARPVVREAIHNSQALFAFFALSNVDIIVARNVLDSHAAGLYAGGLILTKAVLFLPQFIVVLAFPAMASASERRRALTRSLSLMAVLGACAVGGSIVLSKVAMIFVGGSSYREIEDRLWLFAILGTALAMLQLLVYSVLARQGQRSIYLVWAALLVVVALGMNVDSLGGLLAVVVAVDTTLLVVLFALSLVILRHPAPDLDEEPSPVQ
ncbi:lipopolysaccharide biosynthesis protein [Nocardioides sp. AE5]|uniref:lipopolysaccharide biosynthesis protein n=1 Tax=Nocardioides sp. AE5 TaxID=2962573 RepID=UPI002882C39E|nr:lipopolysaccharide biosynthesis protein [Nocardioides sp. AE5]MDT0201309.1 lipopolysaccharide biosynthesis protein [Nocardioides sp. AE5]